MIPFRLLPFTHPPIRVLGRRPTSFNELHNPQRVFHDTAAATSLAFALFFPPHDGFHASERVKNYPYAS